MPTDRAENDNGMDVFEFNTHPFVLKIWLEESAAQAGRATWRGHITHVPTGERRYLDDLDDVKAFLSAFLEEMGVDSDTSGEDDDA